MSRTGLYVHVPFCRSKCRYCSFYSEPIGGRDAGEVVEAMIVEMGRHRLGDVGTIYIGGGSPSALPRELLMRLVEEARRWCTAATEFTVEVNPGQVDQAMLNGLRAGGVNRLSIGAQSFSERELDFLGRSHTADCTGRAVRQGRKAGFENISLDLIFAVPGSSVETWRQNLAAATDLGAEHISAYALTYEEDTPLGRDVAAGLAEPVDEETDRQMYEMTIDMLGEAGLEQYEISNFAKAGFECRHNLNYWANGSYIGTGPAATSYLSGTRSTNIADIQGYIKAIAGGRTAAETSETLDAAERACETAVLNLRRRRGIDLAEFESTTGYDAMKLFARPIRMFLERGLMETAGGRLFLTREALGIADSILCEFSAV